MKSKMKSEASSSNSRNIRGESVVVDCGRRRSSCGYCRSSGRTSISHGLWANSITVDDYQDLLDRGWRRSGCFLYKPQMDKTCCPAYTIRLRASDFVHSKEQLRVHRRMLRWIPFDIVRPLLDRKKYVVFSDFATTQNGETSLCSVSETMEQQICVDHSDQEDFKERFMDNEDDEEMIEPESDSSGDELGPETSDQKSGIADDYVTNILIGLKGSRFRYKDIQQAFGRTERSYLESQLRRYRRVVGAALSEQMTYSIG